MKIRPVGDELFHADGQTVRHDAANSGFRNFAKESTKGKRLFFFTVNMINTKLIIMPCHLMRRKPGQSERAVFRQAYTT